MGAHEYAAEAAGNPHSSVGDGLSSSWTAVGHAWAGTSTSSEPPASLSPQYTAEPTSVDVSLLMQQQRQMAERLKQMEAMMAAQQRAHALEKVRMDLQLATAEATTVAKGGEAPTLRASANFLQSCIHVQAMWRGQAVASRYKTERLMATDIQAAMRKWLATRQLVAARGAAIKLSASARRRAAVLERAWLLRERSAARVQAAFRAYKAQVLDALR